jgi:uncharacterized membrane protein
MLTYTVIWSYFLIVQMETFNIGMFDYGVAYNLVWKEAFGVASYPSQIGYLPYLIPSKLISFIIVPYMRFFPASYNLLILQSFVISMTGLGLFLLAKSITGSGKLSLIVEIVWLLYYPNAAANGFPFHYMTLFPLFYVFGYLFLVKGKLFISSAFFSLAAFTDLLVPIILLFSVPLFIYTIKRFQIDYSAQRKNLLYFVSAIILISIFILTLNYLRGGVVAYSGNVVSPNLHVSLINGIILKLSSYRIGNSLYILFMILPLLFTIFFVDFRFLLAAIPSLLYYIMGGVYYLRFEYPMQYSSLISPILFIAFCIFLSDISIFKERATRTDKRRHDIMKKSLHRVLKRNLIAVLIAVLLLNIGLFSLYSPISPANQFMVSDFNANPPANGGYGWYNNLTVSTYDHDLLKMMSLIPQNASVLGDFGMAQLADRYYFTYPGQYNPAYPIDYAINNPKSPFFTVSVDNTYPDFYSYNMLQLSNIFLENSSYGIYAESQGAILFKHDYSGKPVFYIPVNDKIQLSRNLNGALSSDSMLIAPGSYDMSAILSKSSSSALYLNSVELGSFNGTRLNVTFNMPLYEYVVFSMKGAGLGGTIFLNQTVPAASVNVSAPQPPPALYRTFSANYSNFSPVIVNSLHLNTESFSYFYMINLTTYEDGLILPENIGNDSQVFSLGNSVWDQIENDGEFEYGFRSSNYSLSDYIKPYTITPGRWVYIEAVYNSGYADLFINGYSVFSAQIFPQGISAGNISTLEIGGAHPFLHNGMTYPNSNPLNASIANFVILNGSMTLTEIRNPQLILDNIHNNPNVVFSDWVNAKNIKTSYN